MREADFLYGLDESVKGKGVTQWLFESLQERVVVVFKLIKEQCPATSVSSPLVLCLTCRYFLTNRLSIKEETRKMILNVMATILESSIRVQI